MQPTDHLVEGQTPCNDHGQVCCLQYSTTVFCHSSKAENCIQDHRTDHRPYDRPLTMRCCWAIVS